MYVNHIAEGNTKDPHQRQYWKLLPKSYAAGTFVLIPRRLHEPWTKFVVYPSID